MSYERNSDYVPTVSCFMLRSLPIGWEINEDADNISEYILSKEYPNMSFDQMMNAYDKMCDSGVVYTIEDKYSTLDVSGGGIPGNYAEVGFTMPDEDTLTKEKINACFEELLKIFESHLYENQQ